MISVGAWLGGRATGVPLVRVVSVKVSTNASAFGAAVFAPHVVVGVRPDIAVYIVNGKNMNVVSIQNVGNPVIGAIPSCQVLKQIHAEHGRKPFAGVFTTEVEDDGFVVTPCSSGDGGANNISALIGLSPNFGGIKLG